MQEVVCVIEFTSLLIFDVCNMGSLVHTIAHDSNIGKGGISMDKKKMSIREKLKSIKEINQRNEQRRQEFIEKQKREINGKLFEMLENGEISREEFERLFKK